MKRCKDCGMPTFEYRMTRNGEPVTIDRCLLDHSSGSIGFRTSIGGKKSVFPALFHMRNSVLDTDFIDEGTVRHVGKFPNAQ